MSRRKSKVDQNQAEIVAALRAVGASVECLHSVGGGVPDLLVGSRGVTYLMEVKTATGSLTPDQERWHPAWRGQVAVVRSVAEAYAVIGVEVRCAGGGS